MNNSFCFDFSNDAVWQPCVPCSDVGPGAPQLSLSPEEGETVPTPDIKVGGATTVGVVLTGRQLILRRGLTLLLAVSSLVVAVLLKYLFVSLLR